MKIRLKPSVDPVEQLFSPRLEIEPGILMRLVAGNGRDALHEVEGALGLTALLGKRGLNDLRRLRLAEAALAQEFGALVVGPRDNAFARGLDAVDERQRRGIGKPLERRRRLVGEA